MPAYAVIQGQTLITHTARIATARRHSKGIAGRKIVKHDSQGERFELVAFRGNGRFAIYGKEVE